MNEYHLIVRVTLPDGSVVELKLPIGSNYDNARRIVDETKTAVILSV